MTDENLVENSKAELNAADELKAYLEGVYPDFEISLENDGSGNYVYKAAGVEFLSIPTSEIEDAYAQLSGSGVTAGDTKETDVNKLNRNTNRRRNYGSSQVINIDVNKFNSILTTIGNGSTLIENSGTVDSSGLTGDLASYFNSYLQTFGLGSMNTLINSVKTDASNLEFKVDASLKAYQEIDEDLKYGLNVVFANIFSMDSTEIATYNMSLEEREDYIDGLITSYSEILDDFKEQYTALMGEGAKLDSDAFTAWASMINYFPVLDSNATTVNANLFLDNGNVNLNQLSLYSSAWNDSGIKDKLAAYISGGKSWEESGLSSYNSDVTHISESGFLVHMANVVNGTDGFNSFLTENGYNADEAYDNIDLMRDGLAADKSVLLKYLGSDSVFNIDSQFKDKVATKNQLEADIYTLENTIYNYRQYKGLMPYEIYANDPKYSLYLAGDLSFALTDPTLSKDGLYNYLDSSEVALYKLILDTEGEEKANGYITALSDTINQRKGYEIAANFCQNMNQDGGDVGDFLYAGAVGFGDGVETFFSGLSNFFGGADGVRSVQDYEHMYKVQLLGSSNDYTSNLSTPYRDLLKFQYQALNSVGNNAIPMLISFTPIPGARTISSTLMGLSAAGNSAEDALQNGATMGQAYLYGSLSGASEVLLERVLGSLPGISNSSYAQGSETLLQSMFGEAKEEFVQTYLDGAFRSTILGEPFDLTGLTGDALTAGLTAMYCAGISNIGGKCLVKIGDTVVNLATDGETTSYLEWSQNVTTTLATKFGIDLSGGTTTTVNPDNMVDIESIQYNDETHNYVITTKTGQMFTVNDIDNFRNLISNRTANGFDFCNTGGQCVYGPLGEYTVGLGNRDVTKIFLEASDQSPFLQKYGDHIKIIYQGGNSGSTSSYIIQFDTGLKVETYDVMNFDYDQIAAIDQAYYNAHGSDQQWFSHTLNQGGSIPTDILQLYNNAFGNLSGSEKTFIFRSQDAGSCTLATLTDVIAQHMIQNGGVEAYQGYFDYSLRNADGSVNTNAIIAELGIISEQYYADAYAGQGNQFVHTNKDGKRYTTYTPLVQDGNGGYIINPNLANLDLTYAQSGSAQNVTEYNGIAERFLAQHGINETFTATRYNLDPNVKLYAANTGFVDGKDSFLTLRLTASTDVDYTMFDPNTGYATYNQHLLGGHMTAVNTALTNATNASGVVVNTWTGEAFIPTSQLAAKQYVNDGSYMVQMQFTPQQTVTFDASTWDID